MNENLKISGGLADIDPIWAKSGEHLPKWFISALSVPREEGYVEIDGSKTHYFRWGDREKPKLLMTHGLLSHARCFAFIAPFLANDFDIVAFDLAGMGDSEMRGQADPFARGHEFAEMAEALDLFAGGHKPTIIAHSFGSSAALYAVSENPGAFSGVIVCDLVVMKPEEFKQHLKDGRSSPGSGDPDKPNRPYPSYEAARDRYALVPPQPVNQPFLLDYMAFHSLRRVGQEWTWKFSPEVFRRINPERKLPDSGHQLASVPGRKAIVYGERSRLFTRDSIAYLEELGCKDIPIIAVPEAHHHLMLDEPLGFVTALRTILEFWKQGPPPEDHPL